MKHRRGKSKGRGQSFSRPLESGVAQGIGWALVALAVYFAFQRKVTL